jgi:demethylmenaquinone methyltransferase/2-methoxy-6-polyprenyl-1,4-benzoquinol methylase
MTNAKKAKNRAPHATARVVLGKYSGSSMGNCLRRLMQVKLGAWLGFFNREKHASSNLIQRAPADVFDKALRDHRPAPAGDDQAPEAIRRMFADVSPTYDLLNRLLSGRMDQRWRRQAARSALDGLVPCRRVLDLATGTGDLAGELARVAARRLPPAPIVHGADFTGPMLKQAPRKLGWEGFRWTQADGLRLPYVDGAFDAVTIAFGLRNMADRQAGLAEMARVTRPGGRVVILEFSRPKNPIVRALDDAYARRVMPRVGAWISRSRAYFYLADSIREFWEPELLAERMGEAGLADARFRRLLFGIVCVHVGTRG